MARRPVSYVSWFCYVARIDADGGDGRVSRGGVDAALVSKSFLCFFFINVCRRAWRYVPSMAPGVVRGVAGVVGVSLGVFATRSRSALVRLSPIRVPSSRFVSIHNFPHRQSLRHSTVRGRVLKRPSETRYAAFARRARSRPRPEQWTTLQSQVQCLQEDYNLFTIPMDPTGDDDNLEDLCMGTQRTYDEKLKQGKFELVGVNCGGDSFVEGDVLFTMYPKYELSY